VKRLACDVCGASRDDVELRGDSYPTMASWIKKVCGPCASRFKRLRHNR
jgi:hypothetical protein